MEDAHGRAAHRFGAPERAIIQVENYLEATSQLSQTTLRSVLGQHELDEMLSERERLNADVQSILDIQTDAIREEEVDGSQRQVMPYAALVYGVNGETWAYINPEPLTYTRQPVSVDYIDADLAILLEGPPSGTEVVTVGVSELFGVDTGVGK